MGEGPPPNPSPNTERYQERIKMFDYKRADRVGALMQREISEIIHRQVKDPRVRACSITRVDVSDDLRHAKVRVSVVGDEEQSELTIVGLENAAGFIRREIGKRLSLRHTPEMQFILDKSVDHILTIDRLLKEAGMEEEFRNEEWQNDSSEEIEE